MSTGFIAGTCAISFRGNPLTGTDIAGQGNSEFSKKRRRAIYVLIAAGIVFAASLTLFFASIPIPATVISLSIPKIDTFTTDTVTKPSIQRYVGKRVELSGLIRTQENGKVILECPHGASLPFPWFSDADQNAILLIQPKLQYEVGSSDVIGTFQAIPDNSYPGATCGAVVQVDSVRSTINRDVSLPTTVREMCQSASEFVFLLLVLLTPLWLGNLIVVLSPGLVKPASHQCPSCGYDCRGSPRRCPECGSCVEPPNFRIDLDTK